MNILSILFQYLRNGEYLQLMKNILKIVSSFNVEELKITDKVTIFKSYVNSFDEAFRPIAGEELTEELQELDTRRDKALIGIKLMLQCMQYREEEELVDAATTLLDTYEKHGKRIDKLPYQQQTAVTFSLLRDFKNKPKLARDLTKVSLNGWVTLLDGINNMFDSTYVERAKTEKEPAELAAKREQIKDSFLDLAGDIEAYARIAPNKEAYAPVIAAINGIIKDYNQAAQNRLRSNASASDIVVETSLSE